MTNIFLPDQVLKIDYGIFHTYVIVVEHISRHRLGFKSLLALDSPYSISVTELKDFDVTMMGFREGELFHRLIAEMKANEADHKRAWNMLGPEKHYNNDLALAELHKNGVATSRSRIVPKPGTRK